jgi:hypothetical protein
MVRMARRARYAPRDDKPESDYFILNSNNASQLHVQEVCEMSEVAKKAAA